MNFLAISTKSQLQFQFGRENDLKDKASVLGNTFIEIL